MNTSINSSLLDTDQILPYENDDVLIQLNDIDLIDYDLFHNIKDKDNYIELIAQKYDEIILKNLTNNSQSSAISRNELAPSLELDKVPKSTKIRTHRHRIDDKEKVVYQDHSNGKNLKNNENRFRYRRRRDDNKRRYQYLLDSRDESANDTHSKNNSFHVSKRHNSSRSLESKTFGKSLRSDDITSYGLDTLIFRNLNMLGKNNCKHWYKDKRRKSNREASLESRSRSRSKSKKMKKMKKNVDAALDNMHHKYNSNRTLSNRSKEGSNMILNNESITNTETTKRTYIKTKKRNFKPKVVLVDLEEEYIQNHTLEQDITTENYFMESPVQMTPIINDNEGQMIDLPHPETNLFEQIAKANTNNVDDLSKTVDQINKSDEPYESEKSLLKFWKITHDIHDSNIFAKFIENSGGLYSFSANIADKFAYNIFLQEYTPLKPNGMYGPSIICYNPIDGKLDFNFTYLEANIYKNTYEYFLQDPNKVIRCNCKLPSDCSDHETCPCARMNLKIFKRSHSYIIKQTGQKILNYFLPNAGILECDPSCECNKSICRNSNINSLNQQKYTLPLDSFRLEKIPKKFIGNVAEFINRKKTMWSLKTICYIPMNTFVLEYTGEIINKRLALKRKQKYNELYNEFCSNHLINLNNTIKILDLEQNSKMIAVTIDGCYDELRPIDQKQILEIDFPLCIDASYYGNLSRFINQSCEPNLKAIPLYIEHKDVLLPRIAIFSLRDINIGEELTIDYSIPLINDMKNENKKFICLCGSKNCRGSLYKIEH